MFRKGEGVLVACSGGPDSTALSCLLHRLAPKLGLRLELAHVNYGLRGRASDGDEGFVRDLALDLGLPFSVLRAPKVPAQSNFQAWARDLRYRWFGELARHEGLSKAATAHSADDQAETLLERLGRGAGPEGLAGIRPRAVLGGLEVVRPLLTTEAADLKGYLRGLGRGYRKDASNLKPLYLRNRIRKLLVAADPGRSRNLSSRLSRTALQMGELSLWIQDEVLRLFGAAPRELALAALRRAPRPVARAALKVLALSAGVREEILDFGKLEAALVLLQSGSAPRSAQPLGGGKVFLRKGGVLRIG